MVDRVPDLEQAVQAPAARSRLASSASTLAKSSSLLRQRSAFSGGKLWPSIASISRGSNGSQPLVAPKRAVRHVAAGAAGDLRHLGRAQAPLLGAVELGEAGERDMGHVHVEAHADRVGRDQMLDLAGLVHGDLGVAGARRQGAQHDRGTALLAADHLGQRVDLGRREGDHDAAPRQAMQLAVAGDRTGSRSAAG